MRIVSVCLFLSRWHPANKSWPFSSESSKQIENHKKCIIWNVWCYFHQQNRRIETESRLKLFLHTILEFSEVSRRYTSPWLKFRLFFEFPKIKTDQTTETCNVSYVGFNAECTDWAKCKNLLQSISAVRHPIQQSISFCSSEWTLYLPSHRGTD